MQEKALETVDKEDSAESNDSDLEEVEVDRDLALKEKERVRTICGDCSFQIIKEKVYDRGLHRLYY